MIEIQRIIWEHGQEFVEYIEDDINKSIAVEDITQDMIELWEFIQGDN